MEKHNRHSIRLKGYDYSSGGVYYITICTKNRKCIFGQILGNCVYLNDYGIIAKNEWLKTEINRNNVDLDAFVIMPNHMHGILIINHYGCSTAHRAPTKREFGKPIMDSLPTIIGAYKSAVTHKINVIRNTPGAPIWQRNYYEHIVRNERALFAIRKYIINNPNNWKLDDNIDMAYHLQTEKLKNK